MRLRRADTSVHVAEVGETAEPLVIELCKRGDEAIAFARCQPVRIFSDADHARRGADDSITVTVSSFDPHVTGIGAGLAKFSGDKKCDPISINWNFQLQTRAERSTRSRAKNYVAAVCCGTSTDTHGWGPLALRAGRIRYSNPARSRRPRDKASIGGSTIVNLNFNVHLASPSETVSHKKAQKRIDLLICTLEAVLFLCFFVAHVKGGR